MQNLLFFIIFPLRVDHAIARLDLSCLLCYINKLIILFSHPFYNMERATLTESSPNKISDNATYSNTFSICLNRCR